MPTRLKRTMTATLIGAKSRSTPKYTTMMIVISTQSARMKRPCVMR
jgi:hypothetical protein